MKPIKIVFEDDTTVNGNDLNIEIIRKFPISESNLGVFDCSDMTDEEIDEIVEKLNNVVEVYPISAQDLKKALEMYENKS